MKRPFIQILHGPEDNDGDIVDLREALGMNIIQCLKPEQLPDILQRLMRLKQRTSYFLKKGCQRKRLSTLSRRNNQI